jgi:acylpyruvate hydrolase
VEGEWIFNVRAVMETLERRRVPRPVAQRENFKQAARILLDGGAAPRDMIEILARGETWNKALSAVTSALAKAIEPAKAPKNLFAPLAKTRLLAPISRPGKITCVGLNYADHAREQGEQPPDRPIFFLKSANTICGPGDPVHLPVNSTQVDYEAEFAVVIGKAGKRIPQEKAMEYVAGYMILNDVSARDMQFGDKQWYRGKSCDTFAPSGPWIVTKEEVPDPHNLRISLMLNGQTMQDSNTSNLIFNVPFLVSYLSQCISWETGDLISTGTPPGVGVFRKPQVFLKSGDSMSITVERLGTLVNSVVAD